MRVRFLLEITSDDTISPAAEVAAFEKVTERPEDLGLSIAEGKAMLAAAQRQVVDVQVESWADRHRACEACGKRRRGKGSYSVIFMTLYGDVRLCSQRLGVPSRNGKYCTLRPLGW
jgi:hypothetical protein